MVGRDDLEVVTRKESNVPGVLRSRSIDQTELRPKFLAPEKGIHFWLDYFWSCGMLATVRSPLVEGPETGCDDSPLLISWYRGYDEEGRDVSNKERRATPPVCDVCGAKKT